MLFWVCGPVFSSAAQSTQPAPTAPGITVAQYRLLSKGEPMPYTGVAVGLETYRMEGRKFEAQAALIAGLKEELAGTKAELDAARQEQAKTTQLLDAQTLLTVSAQQTSSTLQTSLAATQKAYEAAKPRWFESPIFLIGSGFIGGAFAAYKLL